jgi:hypothetical protein
MSENKDQEKEMGECQHCKRLNWLCKELEEFGYDIDPDDVAAMDGLAETYAFPFLMILMGQIELLRWEYDDNHNEEKILGDYQKQMDCKEEKKEIKEEKKEGKDGSSEQQ